jgi:hypothetical protein
VAAVSTHGMDAPSIPRSFLKKIPKKDSVLRYVLSNNSFYRYKMIIDTIWSSLGSLLRPLMGCVLEPDLAQDLTALLSELEALVDQYLISLWLLRFLVSFCIWVQVYALVS